MKNGIYRTACEGVYKGAYRGAYRGAENNQELRQAGSHGSHMVVTCFRTLGYLDTRGTKV